MKRIERIVLLVTVALMLSGCQNAWSEQGRYDWNSASSSVETSSSATNDSTSINESSKELKVLEESVELETTAVNATNVETNEMASEEAIVETKPERNGFNEFNNTLEFGIIQMEFPSYWMFEVTEDSDDKHTMVGLADYDATKDSVSVALQIQYWVNDSEVDINVLRAATTAITEKCDKAGREYSSEFYTNQIMRSYKVTTTDNQMVNGEEERVSVKFVPFIIKGENYLYYIEYYELCDSAYSYDDDFDKMLASIKKTETVSKKDDNGSNKSSTVTKNDNNKNSTSGTNSNKKDNNGSNKSSTESQNNNSQNTTTGVNPDMKAFLDSYEAFVDKYVAFMKKYLNSSSSGDYTEFLGMYQEYIDILSQLQDFETKADKYNSSGMSKEDLAYYLDSLNRIQKKMLSVYE